VDSKKRGLGRNDLDAAHKEGRAGGRHSGRSSEPLTACKWWKGIKTFCQSKQLYELKAKMPSIVAVVLPASIIPRDLIRNAHLRNIASRPKSFQSRKLPGQVDSSEVEFFPASNRSRTQPGAGFPARHGVVLRYSFVATDA
jgi:hypothetical protein